MYLLGEKHDKLRKILDQAIKEINKRFKDEKTIWSRWEFTQLIDGHSLDDPRILFTLYGWEDSNIVLVHGERDEFIEVIKEFPEPL